MKVRDQIPTAENSTNMNGFGTCEVGTTLENLKAAIAGETGASAKYAAFAKAAKEQGYDQIARLFEATSAAEQIHIGLEYKLVSEMEPGYEKPAAPEAESVHAERYLAAYNDIDAADDDAFYLCPVCGYIHKGDDFEKCPICFCPKASFKQF